MQWRYLLHFRQCPRCDTLIRTNADRHYILSRPNSLTCSACKLHFCLGCKRATDNFGRHEPGADRQCKTALGASYALYALMVSLLYSKISPTDTYFWVYWGFVFTLALLQWVVFYLGTLSAPFYKNGAKYLCGLFFTQLFLPSPFISIIMQDI